MHPSVSRQILTRAVMAIPVLTTVISGCASNPATGGTDFVLMSEETEVRIGQEAKSQVLQQYKRYPNEALQDYVSFVGQRLVAVSERSHLEFSFTVVSDDIVNAFTLPGGHVFVTSGMLAHLGSEAELAAVLGHEIGHTTARHVVRQQSGSTVLGALGSIASAVTGSNLAGSATGFASGALLQGYSRKHELEADELAARYLGRVGYSPEAMIEVIDVLKQQEAFEIERARIERREPKIYHGFFASHPSADVRLREAIDEAKTSGAGSAALARPTYFLAQIEGLVYGDTSNGVIRDNIFYHPALNLKINFPDSWLVRLDGTTLVGQTRAGDALMQVRAFPVDTRLSARDFLVRQLKITRIRDGSEVQVAGMPAYLAIAEEAQSPFGRRPVRYAIVIDEHYGQAYVFAGAGRNDSHEIAADGQFIATIFSFGRMTQADYKRVKPPAIKILTARSGTTMETLAVDAAIPKYTEQRLRLLNGIYPDGEPKPGDLVKTVE